MKPHIYQNSDPTVFDGNCAVCGGKHRDSVHGPTDEIRANLVEAANLVAGLVAVNPGKRFAIAANGSGIGLFSEEANRFVAIAEKAITGPWVRTDCIEFLVNGERLERDWQEVA